MVRVVLLGASNLAREPWIVIETARLALGTQRMEVFGAFGHGRSYGQRSWLLGRNLPGILECGLWKALDACPPAPTFALLTDIGNDILYGASAARIAGWVEECVRRLEAHDARMVMTGLPMVSLEGMTDFRIRLVSRILFPSAQVTPTDIRRQVLELDGRLREMATRRGVAWSEHQGNWYGVDPIHILRRRAPRAYGRILRGWAGMPSVAPTSLARASLARKIRLRCQLPESWRLFGWELGGRQDILRWPGPSSVSLY